MDVFHRAYSQLQNLYRSMTPGSRMTAGLLAVAVLAGVVYLGTRQSVQSEVDLLHGMPVSNEQLLKMQAALGKAHLSESVVRGSSLYVPRGQEAAYMAALSAASALPQNMADVMETGAGGNSLLGSLESTAQREQRMRLLKQQALALAIGARPGIERAYVLYDIDTKPGGFKDKVATAIAYVKPTGSNQLDAATVADIRNMVAPAYVGLTPENVTVSDQNGRTWPGNAAGIGAAEDTYLSLKRACERDLKVKIQSALSYIPNVTVELNVELDHKQAARAKPSNRTADFAGNRLGREPAHANPQNHRPDLPQRTARLSDVTTLIDNVLSGGDASEGSIPQLPAAAADEPAAKEIADWTPASARVSIGVPLGFFKQLWRERNPAEVGRAERIPSQVELDRIRDEESTEIVRCVAPLLPPARGAANPAESITVTFFQELSSQQPSPSQMAWDFWSVLNWILSNWNSPSWRIGGGSGLAFVLLLTLRWMVRRRSAVTGASTTSAAPTRVVDAAPAKPANSAAVAPPHWRRQSADDRPLRAELSELVEEDPETAANILRNWIGQVS